MTTAKTHVANCSFCAKPNTDVRKLVGGAGVYICDECVSLCNTILATKSDGPPPPLAWQEGSSLDEVLRILPNFATTGAQVERQLALTVQRARTLGATWARIGEALGTTRQSAWERFSGEE